MDRVAIAKWGGIFVLAATVGVVIWQWPHWRASAAAGSAYAARITCSCRYIEGRSAESCAHDIADDASMVSIAESPEEKAITGSVPLLGRATARFKPGYGCLMQQN